MSQIEASFRKLRGRVESVVDQLNETYRPEIQQAIALVKGAQQQQGHILSRLADLEAKVRKVGASKDRAPRTPEEALRQLPGYRHPQYYGLTVSFTAADTAPREASVEISPEGPFIITDVDAMYRVTDSGDDIQGRLIPLSGMRFFAEQGASLALTGAGGLATRLDVFQPEFDFQIDIDGSGRRWTNQNIPGFVLDPTSRNNYTGVMGWVDPTDRIRVTVSPVSGVAVPKGGGVIFVFSGLEVVNPVRLADIMKLR